MIEPLRGIKVIEIAGLGPAPFAGAFLVELGADVTLVQRPGANAQNGMMTHGKTIVILDLKSDAGRAELLSHVATADVLIEGMRPGVMERLSLGPDAVAAVNPKLIYGRMTGWGQDGPLAQAAGHDINYIALSGALWYASQPGSPPLTPPTLIGDIGGGSLYLMIGILSALLHVRATGQGQVIDAAIVDGSAHMMNLLHSVAPVGREAERGQGLLDGPHWYNSYLCSDGRYVTIGSLEPHFYALLLDALGLTGDAAFADQMNRSDWPALTARLAAIFRTRSQDEWCAMMEGTDICFAPVLSPANAAQHPHMVARNVYDRHDSGLKAARAPRFRDLT